MKARAPPVQRRRRARTPTLFFLLMVPVFLYLFMKTVVTLILKFVYLAHPILPNPHLRSTSQLANALVRRLA